MEYVLLQVILEISGKWLPVQLIASIRLQLRHFVMRLHKIFKLHFDRSFKA